MFEKNVDKNLKFQVDKNSKPKNLTESKNVGKVKENERKVS